MRLVHCRATSAQQEQRLNENGHGYETCGGGVGGEKTGSLARAGKTTVEGSTGMFQATLTRSGGGARAIPWDAKESPWHCIAFRTMIDGLPLGCFRVFSGLLFGGVSAVLQLPHLLQQVRTGACFAAAATTYAGGVTPSRFAQARRSAGE
ncbi:hypothetical protein [Adhaeretor mobilis]|uniref:hypothetical protein n=1 Tax=Adhaeretor mobilis TaxID=1930276 RepID=UPI00119E7166|nr:hypothetical protein [Adhaeretor mobilis]